MILIKEFSEFKRLKDIVDGTYTIKPDGSIDVIGDVYLSHRKSELQKYKLKIVT